MNGWMVDDTQMIQEILQQKLWNHFFFLLFLDLLAYSLCQWKKNPPFSPEPRCLRPAWTPTLSQALCVVRRDDRTALNVAPGNEPARVPPPAAETTRPGHFLAAELLRLADLLETAFSLTRPSAGIKERTAPLKSLGSSLSARP